MSVLTVAVSELEDVRGAATSARKHLIEAFSLLGSEEPPHAELCAVLASIDTVLRELPEAEPAGAEVTS